LLPVPFGPVTKHRPPGLSLRPVLGSLPPMEYEVQRSTRHCATSGREFAPGEEFYSVLMAEGAELRRYDYASEAWKGPPQGAVGWWKSQTPGKPTPRAHWAPNDVLLGFFDELAGQPDRQDMRYVLALLLVRRRVMRLEEERSGPQTGEVLILYCPRRDATYEVPAVAPGPERVEQIQAELTKLLAR